LTYVLIKNLDQYFEKIMVALLMLNPDFASDTAGPIYVANFERGQK